MPQVIQPVWKEEYEDMYRVLVCGGRFYSNYQRLKRYMDVLFRKRFLLIEGGADGADTLARTWATNRAIACVTCPADWDRHGRSAGPIRNLYMLKEFKPLLVVAFPGNRGTANMIQVATNAKVPVFKVE